MLVLNENGFTDSTICQEQHTKISQGKTKLPLHLLVKR